MSTHGGHGRLAQNSAQIKTEFYYAQIGAFLQDDSFEPQVTEERPRDIF